MTMENPTFFKQFSLKFYGILLSLYIHLLTIKNFAILILNLVRKYNFLLTNFVCNRQRDMATDFATSAKNPKNLVAQCMCFFFSIKQTAELVNRVTCVFQKENNHPEK